MTDESKYVMVCADSRTLRVGSPELLDKIRALITDTSWGVLLVEDSGGDQSFNNRLPSIGLTPVIAIVEDFSEVEPALTAEESIACLEDVLNIKSLGFEVDKIKELAFEKEEKRAKLEDAHTNDYFSGGSSKKGRRRKLMRRHK